MLSREELVSKLGGQTHVLSFWDLLDNEEKSFLGSQIANIDVKKYEDAFKEVQEAIQPNYDQLSPIQEDRHIVKNELHDHVKNKYWALGLKAISRGEVGAIVMAGGQATRLGADQPKGTIKLGLGLSGTDSLFWLQAARIARLLKLAKEAYPDSNPSIQWLVMTSNSTMEETKNHLDSVVKDLGLNMDDVTIFSQAEIPCFDLNGKFLLNSRSSLATSPDGNGGMFYRPKQTVEKTNPSESVGVVCTESGHVRVLEYSEIPKELAEKRDPNGKLSFRAGSVAMHYFTMDFLEKVCDEAVRLPFHVAKKKIPYWDLDQDQVVNPNVPNGIKLEQFVFDVFPYAKQVSSNIRFLVWEVLRNEEFSPLKNAEHVGKDCLSTICRDFEAECRRWLLNAGITTTANSLYISPLITYSGEGLVQKSTMFTDDVIKPTNGLLVENGMVH